MKYLRKDIKRFSQTNPLRPVIVATHNVKKEIRRSGKTFKVINHINKAIAEDEIPARSKSREW